MLNNDYGYLPMQNIESFLSLLGGNPLAATISIVSVLAGVIGTIYTYLQWRSEREKSRLYEKVFRMAEQSMSKDVNENTLLEQEKQIKEASAKISELQFKIQKEIPKEARRAVLADRLDEQIRAVSQLSESIAKIRMELVELGESSQIPAEVKGFIEKEVNPDYITRNKVEQQKTNLTVMTTASAVSTAILPYPLNKFVSLLLLVASAFVLFYIAKLIGFERYLSVSYIHQNHVKPNAHIVAFSVGIGLGGISLSALLVAFQARGWDENEAETFFVISAVTFLQSFAAIFYGVRKWKKGRASVSSPS